MIHFYDKAMIRASSDLTRVPGPLRRLGTVLVPTGPAEGRRTMTFAGSLVSLDPGWRLYYTVSDTAARMRGIAVAESEDGLVWRRPGLGQVRALGQDTPRLAIGGLPADVERYGQPQVCRLDAGRWRMYFWITDRPYLRCVVAHSDDGLRWSVDRFVPAGDDWLLLYTASPCRHREIPTRERAVVRAAMFPRRRFAGLAAPGDRPGSLWTRPFVPGRPQIRLDARIDGWLRTELCDPFGAPLPGLGMDRCRVVSGDSTGHLLEWAEAAASAYAHDAVSLHLEWQDGTLFAIHGDGE